MSKFIQQRISECLTQASEHFSRSFPMPGVQLNLRGQVAGKAWPQSNRLAFNALLYEQNREHFLQQTVAHEVAHLLAWQIYGPQIKPHGREWQGIMQDVFGLPALRCHTYQLPPRLKNLYGYQCGCPQKSHDLSAWRHGRIQRGRATYLCRRCNSPLTFSGHARQQLVNG